MTISHKWLSIRASGGPTINLPALYSNGVFQRISPHALLLLALALTAPACRMAHETADQNGIDLKGMDRAVAPGDDFNAFANGGWMKATEIPADKSYYGAAALLDDQMRQRLLTLIDETARSPDAGTRKIGDFYASYMDEAAIEAKGTTPLKPMLDAIGAISDRRSLAHALGSRLRADVDPLNSTNFQTGNLLGIWIAQGLTDPSHNVPYLLQGGLGMPDREYYLSDTPHMTQVRQQYQAYVEAMFKLAGFSEPAARANRVVALETKMARVHATRTESEDVHNAVSWKRAELLQKAPGLDWSTLLYAAGLSGAPEFLIWHPKAIPGLAALTASEAIDSWKDWLAFHTFDQSAAFLPKAFVEESFKFHGKALSGTHQLRPRWQRGVAYTSGVFGEAVGKLYVDRHFPPATRAKVQAIVADLLAAFAKRIDALTWMTPATKAKAKQKLTTLNVGVGYPDKWQDYSGLEVIKGDAPGNLERSALFEYRYNLAKLNKPPDRGEWCMTPQTVNAVNLPLLNALNFPAAYLQQPYFNPDADDAFNYGSVGATIGHEISHSFDDQGSQFDAEGRLLNWWTKEDFAHFKAAGEALAAQFDAYRPFPDLAVNGHQTLSENIADVAGLSAAYDAYHLSLKGKADAEKQGFTGDQRFFLSYAQSWRSKTREASLRRQIATDGHAPDQYRADSVRNLDAWYDAFAVKPAQQLYVAPAARVHVW